MIDPSRISSWKVKSKTVTGSNIQRMASGRAPIGFDDKSVNLHHLIQTQDGAIAEISQTMHQKYYQTIHINTGSMPSGINRRAFDVWKEDYWANRALDFLD